jgi:hypothetical protein
MNPTPEQIEALNRAIAEYCGIVPNGAFTPYYTSDLNAIVAVVQSWQVGHRRAISMANIENGLPCFVMLSDDNTGEDYRASASTYALALCLAFAKAAELKGWKK